MDRLEAIRIARLALAMNYRIVHSEHERKYINIGHTKQDQQAADAYNVLADWHNEMSEAVPRVSIAVATYYLPSSLNSVPFVTINQRVPILADGTQLVAVT